MSNTNIKQSGPSALWRSIQIIGIIITLLALGFVFQRIWTIGQENWKKLLSVSLLLIVISGGIAHGLNLILLGWSWQKLLVWFGESGAKPKVCIGIYGRTFIAKYIPGNLFHYPSRHIMGNRAGFKHPALVGAVVYEIIGQLVAAGTIALVGFPKEIGLGDTLFIRLAVLPAVIVLPLMIQFILVHFSIGQKLGFPEKPVWSSLKGLLPILLIYLSFYLVDGSIFWILIGTSTGMWFNIPILYIFSTFAISWVIGFITPGAPAGLGVRETIMILILTNFIGEPSAAFVALVSRLVVTLGDLVFFLLAYLLSRKTDA